MKFVTACRCRWFMRRWCGMGLLMRDDGGKQLKNTALAVWETEGVVFREERQELTRDTSSQHSSNPPA